MRGSAAFRAAIAPGGLLAGPWVQNELWRRAKAKPSLDLRFAGNKSLVDATTGRNLVTFTRASNATYVDSTGTLQTASTDVPRFDHNPTTGESLGLLVEEQRQNLLTWSDDFSNAAWTSSNATLSSNAATAPDGSLTFDRYTATAVASEHRVTRFSNTSVSASATLTFSLFVKSEGIQRVRINIYEGPSRSKEIVANANLSAGTIAAATAGGGFTAVGSAIQPFPNGVYRISVTGTIDGSTTSVLCDLSLSSNTGSLSWTPTGTEALLVWGAQLEAGAFPTSYIPTTASAATRSADVATDMTRGAALRTLYGQFRSPASGTRPIVSLDDNSANNRIELFTSGTDPKLLITSGGSAQADLDAGSVTANTMTSLVGRFATDNFAASVSGGNEVTDTSGTLPAADRIRIGRDQAGNYLNGAIARITGWNDPLPMLPPVSR